MKYEIEKVDALPTKGKQKYANMVDEYLDKGYEVAKLKYKGDLKYASVKQGVKTELVRRGLDDDYNIVQRKEELYITEI